MRIGMFDSGVGGLTVLKEFIKYLPDNEYIYFGDTKRVPYGDRFPDVVLEYSRRIIKFLLSKNVDYIVIACNTVSSLAFDKLSEEFDVDIINVITPVIDYIKKKDYKDIAVIGTRNTINSKVYSKNLKNIKTLEIACPLFVPIVEENCNTNSTLVNEVLDYHLKGLKNEQFSALVLGCTHYPILESQIQNYFKKIDIINPAVEVAKYFKENIKPLPSKKSITIYFSDVNKRVETLAKSILNMELELIKEELE